MQMAQVYGGNGADAAAGSHGTGQRVCRNAHAHTALDDGQQGFLADAEGS